MYTNKLIKTFLQLAVLSVILGIAACSGDDFTGSNSVDDADASAVTSSARTASWSRSPLEAATDSLPDVPPTVEPLPSRRSGALAHRPWGPGPTR